MKVKRKTIKDLAQRYWQRLMGFSVVGIVSTLLTFVLTAIFLKGLGLNMYLGYTLAYSLTIFTSYLMNNYWVFKYRRFTLRSLTLYFLVYALSMAIGTLALIPLEHFLPTTDKFFLTILITPLTMTWNFLFSARLLRHQ